MSQNTTDSKRSSGAERRPYERPAVVDEGEFETLALACTQTSPDLISCYMGTVTGS